MLTESTFLIWMFAGLLALIPAGFWLLFWSRKGTPSLRVRQLILRAFFFGAMGIIPLLGVKYMLEYTPNLVFVWELIRTKSFFFSLLILTFVLAGLEEFLKHFSLFSLPASSRNKKEPVVNGVLYFMAAGIGFALMENMIYFRETLLAIGVSAVFWKVFLFRSFGTMLGHALFSGIFGFLWLRGAAARKIDHGASQKLHQQWRRFFQKCQHIPLVRHLFPSVPGVSGNIHLFLEAFFLATFLHAIFNLLISSGGLGINLMMFLPPFLLLLVLFLSHQFALHQQKK